MTALARSIGTQETVLYLDSALDVGSQPAPFLIDSEAVLITGGDTQTQVYVSRAQFGTAAAAHSIGTALVAGWGGGGVAFPVVISATGADAANADISATSVDGPATATTTATASGTGSADGSITVTATGGQAINQVEATSSGSRAQLAADGVGGPGSFVDLQSGGLIQINTTDPTTNLLTDDVSMGAGNGVTASSFVQTASAAPALVKLVATNEVDSTSISVTAPNAASRSELQINGLPLITTGTGAPGGTFVSLLYVDTTAVTGGGYCWDFVSGAYIKIGTV